MADALPLLTEPLRAELLAIIRDKGYTRRDEPFLLSSGGMSNDYVDMRRAVATGHDLGVAARAVLSALADAGIEFDAIGGMTMGADPVAHAAALLAPTSWFSVRKAEKHHGAGRRIEGAPVAGTRVVAFEDTVTTGRSVCEAIDVMRAEGAAIVACITLLDRGRAAAASLADAGFPYLPLFTYADLGIEPIS